MRARFPTILAAIVLCLALPGLAFAQESPSPSPSEMPVPSSSPSPSPSPTQTPVSNLDKAKQRLRDQQVKDKGLIDLLQQADELRKAADLALAKIDTELARASEQLKEAQERAAEAAARLAIVQEELRIAIARLDASKDVLASRATNLYIVGPTGFLPYLLQAGDINEAMMASEYGNRVLRADSDAVNGFRGAAEDVHQKEATARALKHQIDTQVASAQLVQEALQDLKDRQREIRTALFGNMKNNLAVLARILKLANPFAAVLASYNSTAGGFTALIREAQAGQTDPVFTPDWLEPPVPGGVTQGFGWRTHPVYGYLSFHTGADLEADYGDPVHPAQNGKVIDVGYFGPFGLTVLIDHGGSIATLYSHLSEIHVEPGEIVSLKTVIGKIGSTGWATGPHLHFEVRANGAPQEPMRWL